MPENIELSLNGRPLRDEAQVVGDLDIAPGDIIVAKTPAVRCVALSDKRSERPLFPLRTAARVPV
jgi:hypothetical protein